MACNEFANHSIDPQKNKVEYLAALALNLAKSTFECSDCKTPCTENNGGDECFTCLDKCNSNIRKCAKCVEDSNGDIDKVLLCTKKGGGGSGLSSTETALIVSLSVVVVVAIVLGVVYGLKHKRQKGTST
jgi:hypothetical protein